MTPACWAVKAALFFEVGVRVCRMAFCNCVSHSTAFHERFIAVERMHGCHGRGKGVHRASSSSSCGQMATYRWVATRYSGLSGVLQNVKQGAGRVAVCTVRDLAAVVVGLI